MPRRQQWQRGGKRRADDSGRGADKRSKVSGSYSLSERENVQFRKYYKELKIVPDEEWDTFVESLKTSLPTTFRITGSKEVAKEVLDQLQRYFFKEVVDVEIDGEALEAPHPLTWYPNNHAWQMKISRKLLRRDPRLAQLHKYIVYQVEHGHLSRQEAVSMIPPMLLDVKPEHKVLDMCAAPGSKTAQLLEMIHSGDKVIPDGLVVANDADNKRCYLLVHQSKRLSTPAFVVTNEDATRFPSLLDTDGNPIQFDRVLCDVPCSGDGTLRKNANAWRKWTPYGGMGLHDIQVKILIRGLQLLKTGGRLVYSTCSFNPVENEAVVAEVLRQYPDSVKILDVSDQLSGLKRSPGMTTWKLMNRDGEFFSELDEVPVNQKRKYKTSMFPPSASEIETMNLNRCWRLLPHHQDTGGFFVTVLEKTAAMSNREAKMLDRQAAKTSDKPEESTTVNDAQPATDAPTENVDSAVTTSTGGDELTKPSKTTTEDSSSKMDVDSKAEASTETKEADSGTKAQTTQRMTKKPKGERKGHFEEPFVFMVDEDGATAYANSIVDFYGLSEEFPKDLLMTRAYGGLKNNIYLVSPLVKEIVTSNNKHSTVKLVNTGVKLFHRSATEGVPCEFRPCQEGIDVLVPFVTQRKLEMPTEELYRILHNDLVKFHEFGDDWGDKLKALGQGGAFVYALAGTKSIADEKQTVDTRPSLLIPYNMTVWIGRNTVRCLISKQERMHYKLVLGASPEQARTDGSVPQQHNKKVEPSVQDETKPSSDDPREPSTETEDAEAQQSAP